MKVSFVNYGRSYLNLKPDIDAAMQKVLSEGQLILRSEVEVFERKLARYVGTTYAVALNSGTDALVLSLKALGIGKGDEVITSSHTFKATVGAIATVGATPILADIREDGLIDPDSIANKMNATKVKAIIPVHIAGQVCNMEQIMNMARIFGIPVIEDACQALGAVLPRGITQCWSFYPAKILGCAGDGGAVTTNDATVYEYVREARNHFKNDNRDFGINSRMDNLQAAILNVKIEKLNDYIARRKEIARIYIENLPSSVVPVFREPRVWQDFIVKTVRRDELKQYLEKAGIETMINEYPMSPEFTKLPKSSAYEKHTLRVPCNPEMTDEEIYYVAATMRTFFTQA